MARGRPVYYGLGPNEASDISLAKCEVKAAVSAGGLSRARSSTEQTHALLGKVLPLALHDLRATSERPVAIGRVIAAAHRAHTERTPSAQYTASRLEPRC